MNDSPNSLGQKLSRWYTTSSRSARVCFTVVMIVVLLVLIQIGGWQTHTPMCELIGDCPLRATDIQRIQIVLGEAGLEQYEIVENSFRVPVGQRSVYLKAIAEADALPEHLRAPANEVASMNPFLSRSQQEMVERNRKKKQIRELISRLPFVDQAWFEMDESKSRSAFAPAKQTAVVSIRPTAANELSTAEVATIRQVIGGAIAGINPGDIVVTDLTAGRAFQNTGSSSAKNTSMHQVAQERRQNVRRLFYKNKVDRLLRSYPGVEIEVHYQAETKYDPQQNRLAAMPETSQQARSAPMPNMKVSTNGQASITDLVPKTENKTARTKSPDTELASSQNNLARNVRVATVERVGVVVNVPQELVESKFNIDEDKKAINWSFKSKPDNLVDKNFEQLKSEMIEKIRPALPVASFDHEEGYPISILLNKNEANTDKAWTANLREAASEHWPTLAVLLIGLMMLVVVMRSPSSAAHETAAQTLSIDSAAIESAALDSEQPNRTEAEKKLSQLIEQDPDAAAEVIKSWIRKAA